MTYDKVRAATNDELTYFRAGKQWSRLFVAVFNPTVVYSARLDSLPSTFDRVVQISFTSGVGTLTDVLSDMTMYVGTTEGAYDLGIARIRKSAIAGTFYIGETSEINWQSNCYLTVVNDFDLWARHINVIDDSTFYIDYDVTYTNQNSVFDPVPVMGSHRVLKLTGATVSAVFNFSNSYVIDSTISGYSTTCPGSSGITGSTTASPTITFNAPGWYPVYLTVTATNGKTFMGIRYVYVYNDDNLPSMVFQLDGCSVDYDTGGWSFEVTVQDNASIDNIPERALCILFAEEYYDTTPLSIGQLVGSENILAVGRIAEERFSINPAQSEVTFRVQGNHFWFNRIMGFPTGVILTTSTPTNWAEMQSPTVDKVLFRLFHWGSTATRIMDVYLTNDTRLASELVSPSSNLWGQIQEIAFATIHAKPGIDRFGRLFVEVEPQLVVQASRTWATVMTITKEDWHDSVSIERVVVTPTGGVNVSGVLVESSGSGGALFSLSPGHVFKRYGVIEVLDRLLLSTQSQSNQFAGLILGWRNNMYPNNEMKLSANNRMIDCFPRQKIAWSLDSSDNPREVSFNSNFIPRRVEYRWDDETGFLEVGISIEMESVVELYTDGDIPGDGEADLSDPPSAPDFPPLPDFPIISSGDIAVPGVLPVIIADATYGVLWTNDFWETSPHWQAMNGGLTSGQYTAINFLEVCPNGAIYVGSLAPTVGNGFIARASSLGASFVVQTLPAKVWTAAVNLTSSEQIAFWVTEGGSRRFYVGANDSFAAGAVLADFGESGAGNGPGILSYGFGYWLLTRWGAYRKISASGGSVLASGNPHEIANVHLRAGTTDAVYFDENGLPDSFMKGTNAMSTRVSLATGQGIDFDQPLTIDCDPTGTYIMAQGMGAGKARSFDGGSSWQAMADLPPGTWIFRWAGGSKWIALSGSQFMYTEDNGSDWVGPHLGDMLTTFPVPNPRVFRPVGLKYT